MLRPLPTRWFSVLLPRAQIPRAGAALARTGAVRIETRKAAGATMAVDNAELRPGLDNYHRLRHGYARYWPERTHRSPPVAAPAETLQRALQRVEHWRTEADGIIQRLQALEAEQAQLDRWQRVVAACRRVPGVSLQDLLVADQLLGSLIALLPPKVRLPVPSPMLAFSAPLEDGLQCLVVTGPADQVRALRHEVRLLKGRSLRPPPWLRGDSARMAADITRRQAANIEAIHGLHRLLSELDQRHALAEALADLDCLDWFSEQLGNGPAGSGPLVWIRGWTSDQTGATLVAALEQAQVPGLVHFPPPPAGTDPPLLLHNPPWARPFEVFVRALGMPAYAEVDPSGVLAVLMPLLFGYMFGDLGQGLLLMAAGWLLKARWAILVLLLPAGASAALFGLLFGSVFGREDLLPALWLHPLQDPLTVLLVPLIFAVALLALGQVFNALEAHWAGRGRDWWLLDGGLLLLYLGCAGGLLMPHLASRLFPAAMAGGLWYLAGRAWLQGNPWVLFAALGELAENAMRLLVNTISFARVGAFALAHAGLCSAFVVLADAAGPGWSGLAIMLLGNALVIALEALVVSIQTTRLVMFEFFARFYRGQGRYFRPTSPPPP